MIANSSRMGVFCRMESGKIVQCLCVLLLLCIFGGAVGQEEKKGDEKKPDVPQIKDLAPIKKGDADKGDKDKGDKTVGGPEDGMWYIDAKKAYAAAKKDGKSLLINFTGSDWCGWCIKLEGEVFSKPQFKKEALKKYVFLKLDFPADKTKVSEETKKQNDEYKAKFGVSGFPSIYICDAEGQPFAKTGYQAGGPEKYLTHLKGFADKLTERNELLKLAEKEKGTKRAELLDRALSLMDESIVSGHYENLIKEIVKLDKDNKVGLRQKYWAAQDAEERRRVLAKIEVIVSTLDADKALQLVDQAMKEVFLPSNARVDALQNKLFVLKKLQKTDQADKLLDEMVSIDGLTDDRREKILVQKTYNFIETERAEAAMEFISEKINTHPQSYTLRTAKAEILDSLAKHQEAIVEYDEALKVCQESEAIAEIVALKAYSLAALDKMDDATKVFETFVENELHPDWVKADLLIQKAMLLREAERPDAAKLAEKQALELAESDEQRAELQELIDQLSEIDE